MLAGRICSDSALRTCFDHSCGATLLKRFCKSTSQQSDIKAGSAVPLSRDSARDGQSLQVLTVFLQEVPAVTHRLQQAKDTLRTTVFV